MGEKTLKTLGQFAFEAYRENRRGQNHDGTPTPQWEGLGDGVREAWEAAAVAAVRHDGYERLFGAAPAGLNPAEVGFDGKLSPLPPEMIRARVGGGFVQVYEGTVIAEWEDPRSIRWVTPDQWRKLRDQVKSGIDVRIDDLYRMRICPNAEDFGTYPGLSSAQWAELSQAAQKHASRVPGPTVWTHCRLEFKASVTKHFGVRWEIEAVYRSQGGANRRCVVQGPRPDEVYREALQRFRGPWNGWD